MKKQVRIIIYVFTHLAIVFRILFLNRKKKENRLQVQDVAHIKDNNEIYSNQIKIGFKQKGAVLVVIQNKFVYPIIKNEGVLNLPSNLLNSKVIYLSFIGLFQSQIKRIELSELPIQTKLNPSIQKYRSKFRKVKPLLMNFENLETISKMVKRPLFKKNKLKFKKWASPKLSALPKFKNARVKLLNDFENPHTLNCEEVKQELKKQKNEK